MKKFNKYYILNTFIVSLMLNTPLFASDITETDSEQKKAPISAQFENKVITDIISDSKEKSARINSLLDTKIANLKDELPCNILRTAFNTLGTEGHDTVKFEEWTFTRYNMSAKEFEAVMPDCRCVWSNTVKGLWVDSLERSEQNDLIATYSYTGSVFALRNKFSFAVKTTIPDVPNTTLGKEIKSLNLQLDNLRKRIEWASQEPTLSLKNFPLQIENSDILADSHQNAASLFEDSRCMYADAIEKLHTLSDRKNEIDRGAKKYAALAWTTFQLKKIINNSINDYENLSLKGDAAKLLEFLDMSKRNINLHYNTNIKMFYNWATGGSDYEPQYTAFFEESLSS